METEATGTWTASNGETVDVTLRVLPDGAGRFGGVYVTAATKLSSGRPSSAVASVTVEDGDGNMYDYTPVAPNMRLFTKLPDRFFGADFPVGNGPMPARLKWTVTAARIFTGGAWEECEGEGVTLGYYPAGRFGASGGLLTRYPWRWWWGEDCEAPLPIARELIPTEGNPIAISFSYQSSPYIPSPLVYDPASYPFLITGTQLQDEGFCMLSAVASSDDDFFRYPALAAGTGTARGEYAHVFGVAADEEDMDGCLFAQFNVLGGKRIAGDFDICIGLLTGLKATNFTVKRPPEADNVQYSQYDSVEQLGATEVYPLGFSVTGSESNIDKLIWFRLRIKGGVPSDWGYLVSFGYTPDRDNQRYWLAFGVLQLGNVAPPLNPYTGNYAPFVIGGGACRADILNSPKHRGRLTHMRLPDCSIDYYVKWWDEDGACYVLPYSIIGEATEGRQDGSPLYEATRTLRLASPLLTADERKDAMTIAQSPRVAVRPYGGEWSFARLNDYSVSWEAGDEDEATLQIEIIADYGKSGN